MNVPYQILSSIGGLLSLVALAFAAIGIWRMYSLTRLRPWLVALIALGVTPVLHVALIIAMITRFRFELEWVDHLAQITSDLGTIAHITVLLAVARALVLMARARGNA